MNKSETFSVHLGTEDLQKGLENEYFRITSSKSMIQVKKYEMILMNKTSHRIL